MVITQIETNTIIVADIKMTIDIIIAIEQRIKDHIEIMIDIVKIGIIILNKVGQEIVIIQEEVELQVELIIIIVREDIVSKIVS